MDILYTRMRYHIGFSIIFILFKISKNSFNSCASSACTTTTTMPFRSVDVDVPNTSQQLLLVDEEADCMQWKRGKRVSLSEFGEGVCLCVRSGTARTRIYGSWWPVTWSRRSLGPCTHHTGCWRTYAGAEPVAGVNRCLGKTRRKS